MRLINLEDVTAGMRLGEAVRGARGQTLLARGVVITTAYLETLRSLDMPAIYVTEPETADIDFPHPVRPETRARVLRDLAQTFDALSEATESFRLSNVDLGDQNLDRAELTRAVSSSGAPDCLYAVAKDVDFLLEELGNLELHLCPTSIKTPDLYLIQHSLDVTILGLILGHRARWDRGRLRAFGMGLILHDMGKVLIEPALLNRTPTLTAEQFERLKAHTVVGYEIIRALSPRMGSLPPLVAHQHHERQDGSGYPRGLRGSHRLGENPPGQIHDFGALSAVADMYDAMVSQRPYRRAMPFDEVFETIKGYGGNQLCAEAVRIFLATVPPYPVCSQVVVSNGEYAGCRGVVAKVSPRDLARPVVRLLQDANGAPIEPFDLHLESAPQLRVESVKPKGPMVHSLGSLPRVVVPPKPSYAIPEAVLRMLKAG
jgi:HD-GYP domain-containing protein (c-di-GMP phosphodiesterase class II)